MATRLERAAENDRFALIDEFDIVLAVFSIRFYTTTELKKIDENLPETGASQEPGFYYDEVDDEEEMGAPCGPHPTQEAAIEECVKIYG